MRPGLAPPVAIMVESAAAIVVVTLTITVIIITASPGTAEFVNGRADNLVAEEMTRHGQEPGRARGENGRVTPALSNRGCTAGTEGGAVDGVGDVVARACLDLSAAIRQPSRSETVRS